MAKSPSPSGGKSWRDKKKPPAGRRPATGKGPSWTQKVDDSYEVAKRRHRLNIATWSLLFVVLFVAFVVWLFWIPKPTPFLIASVTEYEAPIAPNAFAKEDVERLQSLEDEEVLRCSEIAWRSKDDWKRSLRESLEEAVPGGPDRNLVVIYISMHGVVDGENEPCLIPPSASPRESKNWIRVRELLEYLFAKDRPNRQPDDVKKLLIFDCNRLDVDWKLGLLYNDFAERLQSAVDDVQAHVPGLVVLNSTSPGQIGWAAPELKASVFGLFVWQGLNGAADAEESGNKDEEVTLQELHRYLAAHVGQWVGATRVEVRSQGPMLLPDDADFPLVFAKSEEGTRLPAAAGTDPRWKTVDRLWHRHGELRDKNPRRFHPLAWAEFENKLMRLERLVQSGKAYRDEFAESAKELESLANALRKNTAGAELAAFSFPLSRQLRAWPERAELEAARAHLTFTLQDKKPATKPKTDEPKPDEKDTEAGADKPAADAAAEKTAAKKPAAKPEEPPQPETKQPDNHLAAAAVAWKWSLQNSISDAQRRRKLLDFIARSNRPGETELVEVHFLRMLDAHLDGPLWTTDANLVRRAMNVRELAERAAAPDDERAFYWMQKLLDKDRSDRQRRRAEDLLFVSADDKATVNELFAQLAGPGGNGGSYGEAVTLAGRIAEAFAVRDRSWSEVPYFAQWHLARLHREGSEKLDLHALITETHQLAASLDEALAHGQWNSDLQKLSAGVKEKLENLETAYAGQCRSWKEAGDDTEKLRALADILAAPLVTGKQRCDLREDYLAISGSITSAGASFRVTLSDDSAEKPGDEKPAETGAWKYLDRLKPWWDEHPALMILGRKKLDKDVAAPDAPTASRASKAPPSETESDEDAKFAAYEAQRFHLARQGEEVRRLLDSVPRETERRLAKTKARLDAEENSRKPPATIRSGRSQADRLVRSAAPLLGAGAADTLGTDPAVLLRRLDLHYLLLWQAKRTLDDFWGPRPGEKTSYFDVAAASYLKSAKKLCGEDYRLLSGEANIPNLLATRGKAAKKAVQPPKPKDVWVESEAAAAGHECRVETAEGLPSGTSAVYLQTRGENAAELLPLLSARSEPRPDLRRMGVAVPAADAAQSTATEKYWIPINDRVRNKDLQAVALFRGHLRSSPRFFVQLAGGSETVWEKPDYLAPTVVVKGTERQRTSVVFIFDCSGSMGNLVKVEKKSTSRLEIARGSLKAILNRLLLPNFPYRVGVYVYGHRVGWNPKNVQQAVIRDPRNPEKFVARPPDITIHPSEDVELVLNLGRFTQSEYGYVRRKLDAVRHLGETPLYLAITQAIGTLAAAEATDKRHIVVITDGANYQSDPGDDKRRLRGDVEKALRRPGNEDIQLDIVGFAIGSKDRKGVDEFKALAAKTGGEFHDAKDPTSLMKALERSLGLCQYTVATVPGGRKITHDPLDLNVTCESVPKPADRPVPYLVGLTDVDRPAEARVEVEGSEALELYLEHDRRSNRRLLVHRRYEKDLCASCDKIDATWDGTDHTIFVGAHTPDWEGDAAKFYLSVQNADEDAAYSPRPKEVWIRIEPVLPASDPRSATVYTYYDATFYNSDYHATCYPVPILCCLAPDWPRRAKDARIEFGCKYQKTQPDRAVTVAGFKQQSPRIADAAKATFEIETRRGEAPGEPYKVSVTERHPIGDPLDMLKIGMTPTPNKIVRRFIPKTGTVRHTFFYDDSAAARVDGYRVEFTLRERLLNGASRLAQPLVVRLARD